MYFYERGNEDLLNCLFIITINSRCGFSCGSGSTSGSGNGNSSDNGSGSNSISGASVRRVAAILFRPGYVYSFQGRHSKVSVNKSNPNCLILLSNRTKSNPNLSVSTGTELNPT